MKSFLNVCLLTTWSDSRAIRLDPQIASSDETKEIAFDGRNRQERLHVASSREARVCSAVFRRRFVGGGSNCRQQQSRASADDPHQEDLSAASVSVGWGSGHQPASKENDHGETEESCEERQEEEALDRRFAFL
ncbi:MAG: hypothetical protein FJ311_15760 [Rhodospirillales bacterium]|nr:hypothetical protein [Rhodospirillales bacterium]